MGHALIGVIFAQICSNLIHRRKVRKYTNMSKYRINYIKIYFWQILSLLVNFAALFVVTPMISGNPEIYGVYSVCVGLNIFLQYADLGFLLAGKKYAAETIVTGDRISEKRIVGTSMAILILFSIIVLIGLIVCVYDPNIVIANISENYNNYTVARSLLIILSISIPVTILQKYVEFIYSLRLEEYKVQRAIICGNIIRILSVPLYFFHNRYDIVGYYAFSQLTMFVSCLYILYISRNIGYGVKSLSDIKFHKQSFDLMKGLAMGGFGSTLSWILFYEIDTIAISALFGAQSVAVYAVGRTIQSFVRSLSGIVYSPYNVRFNYFKGKNDAEGMKRFFYSLCTFLSFTIAPIIALITFAKPFTIAWVGPEYSDSIKILQILVLCYVFNSITNPCGSVVFAYNKTKEILKFSVLQPFIFWVGILITVNKWYIDSFAYFKFIACTLSAMYWVYVACKTLDLNIRKVWIRDFLQPTIIAIICSMLVYFISKDFLFVSEKSSIQLLYSIGWICTSCILTYVAYFIIYKSFRKTIINLINNK